MNISFDEILKFWFNELGPKDWFAKNDEIDAMIRHRFLNYHQKAEKGELFSWRSTPHGRLAEIIVLDQFSRNIYRGTSQAFANDNLALILAQEVVHQNLDDELSKDEKIFVYMPFMHSESRLIHDESIPFFEKLDDEDTFRYEIMHKEIIDQFGRFPHRNKILGRSTTLKEFEFLKHHHGF